MLAFREYLYYANIHSRDGLERERKVEIEGKLVKVDASGVGQGWRIADEDSCPANVQQEIAAEIIDGARETSDGYTASNGLRYRWS